MSSNQSQPPFAYDGLDRVFHEKARLGLMSCLASRPDGLSFVELKKVCGLTDGNLSRHIKVLQQAGVVRVHKGYENNRPLTTCELTPEGRKSFVDYISVLEQVVRDAAHAADKTQDGVDIQPSGTALKPT